MTLDRHFQELLTWINDRGDHAPFRTLRILDRGSHGWVECVDAGGCRSAEEVRRFYERQGGYLALLYALDATDFHFENLIAAGEHPVLIDLEALFHPRVGGGDPRQADELASNALAHSVLRVGLLPQRLWANAASEGIDLSGLGAAAGQLSPHGVSTWEGEGTDEMRLVRRRVTLPGGQNRPTLNGAEIDVLEYTEAIAAGFAAVYRLLVEHREELLAETGPLARFAGDEVRVVIRPTQTYARLLEASFHPDVLRDALDRDRLFDRLWTGVENHPHLARLIPAERADLQRGDIPIFTSRPDSRDLWSSADERIVDFLPEPASADVRRRLEQLSEGDLERQLWFVRASLVTLSAVTDQAPRPTRQPAVANPKSKIQNPKSSTPARLMAAARAVGDRLETLALRGDGDVAWIGLTPTSEQHWSLNPLGPDLYDGLPGIALFLAYLGAFTEEERYTALAQGTLATIRRQVARSQGRVTSIGAFSGWGGVLYTLAHLAALWNQPALMAEAEALVEHLLPLIEQDEQCDIMGGAAGCIGGLLAMHRWAPSRQTLAAATRCGDRLIARAQPMEQGIGWTPVMGGTIPLGGFSHGAAGMAWALLELAARTGEERFRAAGLAAMAYERTLFAPAAGNWRDVRDHAISGVHEGEDVCLTAWCHGAPGIGLARLGTLQHAPEEAVRAEIDTALQTTLAHGFGRNHSLCHGDLGNLELLLQGSQTLDDPRWKWHVDRLTAGVLESIQRDGWLCGNLLEVESPGLMTGLAGIGYGLLRLAEPRRVPSVLTLAPPPSESAGR